MSSEDEFFWSRHGTYAAYVFGSGRFVLLDESSVSTLGYRTYREGRIPTEALNQILCRATALSSEDGRDYGHCGLIDGGGQTVSVNLPDLVITASAGTTFSGFAECLPEGSTDPVPGGELLALVDALFSLSDYDTTELVTDRIVLGGHRAPAGINARCIAETAVDWPFEQVVWSESDNSWSVEVESPLAGEIRAFVRQHLSNFEQYWMACVVRENVPYFVYYDDVPDDEDLFPF